MADGPGVPDEVAVVDPAVAVKKDLGDQVKPLVKTAVFDQDLADPYWDTPFTGDTYAEWQMPRPDAKEYVAEIERLPKEELYARIRKEEFHKRLIALEDIAKGGSPEFLAEHVDFLAEVHGTDIRAKITEEFIAREGSDYWADGAGDLITRDEEGLSAITYLYLMRLGQDSTVTIPDTTIQKFYDHINYKEFGDQAVESAFLVESLLYLDERNGEHILQQRVKEDISRNLLQTPMTYSYFAAHISEEEKKRIVAEHEASGLSGGSWEKSQALKYETDPAKREKIIEASALETHWYYHYFREEEPAYHDEAIAANMIGAVYRYDKALLKDVLVGSLEQATEDHQIHTVLENISNYLGFENTRKTLRIYAQQHPEFQPIFEKTFRYIGLDKSGKIAVDLVEDVYEQIDFGNYKPNAEMNAFDKALLESRFTGKKAVLDAGCATGRNLENLQDAQIDRLVGVDIVPSHVAQAQQRVPKAEVTLASWYELPYPDKTFDGISILGRSLPHNTTLEDYLSCFEELYRVGTDDVTIVVDNADSSQGEYETYAQAYGDASARIGVFNRLPGSINDSPDNVHFFDRLVLSPIQFKAAALLGGLDASIIAEKDYRGAEGGMNKNIYWQLQKTNKELSAQQKRRLYDVIRSNEFYYEETNAYYDIWSQLFGKDFVREYGKKIERDNKE